MSNTIISINKPNNDDKKDKEETIGDTPVIIEEDAEKFTSISLSNEQINNFNIDSDNNKITFDLSTLTTVGKVKVGDKIRVNINLVNNNGVTDCESTESVCVSQNIEEQSGLARVKSVCTIENLKSDDYYSLIYNSSDSIYDVPKD